MIQPQPTSVSPAAVAMALAARIDAALPQTQCTRCGYPDCATYARAIAEDGVPINQCPPGGAEGIARLAAITGQAPLPLSAEHGVEAPRAVAFIDEAWCIGCTLCIKACPTDAIVGSHKKMHTVIEAYCTGCELCIPVCPVDCIQLENASGAATGWSAWSEPFARQARQRYDMHRERMPLDLAGGAGSDDGRSEDGNGECEEVCDEDRLKATGATVGSAPAAPSAVGASSPAVRQAAIAAALERARQRRTQGPQ